MADSNYLYIAAHTIDDEVFVGNHPYNLSHGRAYDDLLAIKFDGDIKNIEKLYFDANDGHIRVEPDADGAAHLEGSTPYLTGNDIPYFWELRGVRSGFAISDEGWNIEMAIPVHVLGWDGAKPGMIFGLTVGVSDADNSLSIERGFSWTHDPDRSALWTTKKLNRVLVGKARSIPTDMQTNQPPEAPYRKLLDNVLALIAKDDWSGAVDLISAVHEPRLRPYQAVLCFRANRYRRNDGHNERACLG